MKMFKLAVIGTENSHAYAFCQLINLPNSDGIRLFPDCQVIYAYGYDQAANEALLKDCGVEKIADSLTEIASEVDGAMITSRDGKFHAEYARPFIEAGKPVFVDKPFTRDCEEALELVRFAKAKGVPLCGGSSLKYATEIKELKVVRESVGDEIANGFVAAPLNMENEYGGFWFYSSHLAEMCLEVFGYNPKSVLAVRRKDNICGVINYENYSVTYNYANHCGNAYTCAVYSEKTADCKMVCLDYIYERECNIFIEMLRTGKMEHSYEELIAPVYVLTAIKKAYETDQEVAIEFKEI